MSETASVGRSENRLYEVGYLLVPLLPEEGALTVADETLHLTIERAGGIVTGTTPPRRRPLAYPINQSVNHQRTKFREAYFGAFRFEIKPTALPEIKKVLTDSESVLRFIIVSILPPSRLPLSPRRPMFERPAVAEKPAPLKPEISREEIDREIEGLLIQNA